jgi:hypothetical protein
MTMARMQATATVIMARWTSRSVSLLIVLLLLAPFQTESKEEWKATVKEPDTETAELFRPSPDIAVNGPSHFPKPTRKIDDNVTVIIVWQTPTR